LHSDDYDWLSCYAAPYYEQTSSALDQASSQLTKRLEAVQVPAEVSGRQKHLYSLYKKLLRPEINRQIDKIYDLVALRVIVDNETDCYSALGIVHDLWTPVKEVGVRDYIAKPKQNGYQSIHTNVYIAGKVSEIQIRTRQMHGEAEYGVASHWHYAALKVKNKINSEDIDNGAIFAPDDKVKWVNRLLEVFNQVRDNKELMNSISFEVFNHRIFVYTPKGDVVDLPKGATPIDFAFAIHSDLGRWIQGVKVNGKLEPFSFHLQSGDLCEIIKDKQPRKASRNWLDFVVTNTARKKIKAQLRRAD
jgi:GTP pyrophosphokinase